MLRFIVFFFSLSAFWSCKSKSVDNKVSHGVYSWKTSFQNTEQAFLDSNHVKRIYLRFFDVDISEGKAIPKGKVKFLSTPDREIVPTVFITNRTFYALTKEKNNELVQNILDQIKSISQENDFVFNEVQIDCDWTLKTKAMYFDFLKTLKLKSKKRVSATIRLHQVKYLEKTGVPPVDEGVLMVYNTGEWQKYSSDNSLFEPKVILKYLDNLGAYPIKLNVALPIFSQTLIYRSGLFLNFLKNTTESEIENNGFFEKTDKQREYICTENVFFKEMSFRKGDIVKIEQAEVADLLKIKNTIFEKLKNKEFWLILYHLENYKYYSAKEYTEIYE
jgi:hypothetical protein